MTGLPELRRKANLEHLAASPLRATFSDRYSDLVGRISAEAPRRTGTLAGSYSAQVEGGSLPRLGFIRSGVRYGPYVHRHNPFLRRAATGAISRLNTLLERAAREIERIWAA